MFSALSRFGRAGAPAGRSLEAAIRSLLPDVWYDPSSMETLYQDSAGTTPVTGVEQAVGLMLDKSKGLVLGPELVVNGDFSNGTTGWTDVTAALSVVSGEGLVTAASGFGYVRQTITTVVGKTYQFTVAARVGTSNKATFSIGNGAAGVETSSATATNLRCVYTATATSTNVWLQVGTAGTAFFDNISVRELPGAHAFHTPGDTTTRPVLSRRINLLTKTEQFDDTGVWSRTAVSVTQNAVVAPDGTTTADKLIPSAATSQHFVATADLTAPGSVTRSVYLKAGEYGYGGLSAYYSTPAEYAFVVVNLSNGAIVASSSGDSASVSDAGNGWYRVSLTTAKAGNTSFGGYQVRAYSTAAAFPSLSFAGDGTSGIYIWGASLVPADLAALGYQRVNTATDYDTAEPFKPGESYDGVNDKMVASTGGGATTAFFFCAGIQAKGVGSTQTLWSDTGTNTGYRVRINSSNQLELSAGNGSAYTTIATTATLAVGQRAVVTAWHDGTNLNVQIGSGAVASTAFATATAGTAGFSVGGDNGAASSFFRGWIYEAVYKKDSAMTAAQIATVQRFCAAKAGITL